MPETKTQLVRLPAESSNVPASNYYITAPSSQDYEAEAPAVPISHYLWILRRHVWKILIFVVICVAATYVISARLTPIYESS
ncbi:MAG: hypothetical protein ABSH09_33120, partial [Bryobacteraceae bacterium]